ncbi:MAG: hypothetical protein ACTIKR_01220 [Advenella sp.]|uniref:hypothetical protein n=1 Tax=unclassified Advenella TaxID=2685285 RepID=UPI001868A666|nr:hypothetical protein [Advenella sp. FME57]
MAESPKEDGWQFSHDRGDERVTTAQIADAATLCCQNSLTPLLMQSKRISRYFNDQINSA